MNRSFGLVIALSLLACGGAVGTTKQLAADTPVTTASGAAFEAPKGWFMTTRDGLTTLEAPEHDVTVSLVAIQEPEAQKAIALAWKRVDPAFARKVKQTTMPPAKDGWDGITQNAYEMGGLEKRSVIALALRKGNTQHVALIDGANAGLERRGAQLGTIVSTFHAPGVKEESFAGKTARPLDTASLEAFLADALGKTKVPGLAIAVVQKGKVVYEKGFGPDIGPETLFMIGSTTKSLTTLMMAKLVDEGKIGWDTPVTDVLPTFALGDPSMTKQLRMRHTVCACTGLPRQDIEFFFEYAGRTPEQRIEAMRTMKPTTGFGETFQYSNTMVAAGGFVAAHAAEPKLALGPAYDATMQSRVFGPLGMTSTTLDFAVAKTRPHAMPNAEDLSLAYGPFPLADEEGVVAVRPAGAAWSNVRDMSRWMLLELGHGPAIVSDENLKKRREPQVKITDKLAYGLGLFVENDHGVKVVHHGGNNLGFTSDTFFLPDHDVGVVVLTNGGGSANLVRKVLRRRVLELLFDGKPEAAQTLAFGLDRGRESAAKARAKVMAEPGAEWAGTFAGTWQNASLGKVALRVDGSHGMLDTGEWQSAFGRETEEDGTVRLVHRDRPWAGFSFLPGKDARTLTLEMAQQTYVFERAN